MGWEASHENGISMNFAIIAAGEGSRLAQEGVKWPKPLVRLHGVALVDRLMEVFVRQGATSISIIVNETMTEVQEHVRQMQLPVPLHLLVKSTPSSMHSFYELSRQFDGSDLCLTTVDTIFREEEFGDYIRAFQAQPELDGLMAVTDFVDDEKPLYVQTNEALDITGFLDQPGDCRYVSGGIYCLRNRAQAVLDRCVAQGMSRMRNYQRQLVAEGLHLKAHPFAKIIDVDHAEDIRKAEQFLQL